MSKIVVAVNVMIVQKDKITNVINGGTEGELFFVYDKKHKWSMMPSSDGHTLFYYPGSATLTSLASIPTEEWDDSIDMVIYRSKDIGTIEARQSFAELYAELKQKKFGMDKVLDEIISSDLPF